MSQWRAARGRAPAPIDSQPQPPHEPQTLEEELAESQARDKLWQPRYKQLWADWRKAQLAHDPQWGDQPNFNPRYDWMTVDNVGEYMLFRVDMMEHRQIPQSPEVVSWRKPSIVSDRLSRLTWEMGHWWPGQKTWDEFQDIRLAFEGAFGYYPSPRQTVYVRALKRRGDRLSKPPAPRPPRPGA